MKRYTQIQSLFAPHQIPDPECSKTQRMSLKSIIPISSKFRYIGHLANYNHSVKEINGAIRLENVRAWLTPSPTSRKIKSNTPSSNQLFQIEQFPTIQENTYAKPIEIDNKPPIQRSKLIRSKSSMKLINQVNPLKFIFERNSKHTGLMDIAGTHSLGSQLQILHNRVKSSIAVFSSIQSKPSSPTLMAKSSTLKPKVSEHF